MVCDNSCKLVCSFFIVYIGLSIHRVKKRIFWMYLESSKCLLSFQMWKRLWYLNILIILLQVPYLASKGLMKFRNIQLHSTLTNTLSGKCCEDDCKSMCQVYLYVCLPDYKSNDGTCVIDAKSVTPITKDSNSTNVIFSRTYGSTMSMVLIGLHQNATNTESHIDEKLFEITDKTPLSFHNSTWHQLSYKRNSITLDLDYKLTCFPYFYGNRCNKYCKSRDDAAGHYSCDVSGNRICKAGWVGDYCTEKRKCNYTCVNGHCNEKSYRCVCDRGWDGLKCNTDLKTCVTRPCYNGGLCKPDGKCKCTHDFFGDRCELKQSSQKPSRNTIASTRHHTALSSTLQPTTSHLTQTTTPFVKTPVFSIVYPTISKLHTSETGRSKVTFSTAKKPVITSLHTVHHTSPSSSTKTMFYTDASKLIETTSWMLISSSHIASSVAITTRKPIRLTTSITVPLAIVLALIILLISFVAFVYLWKRSNYRRRRSKTIDIPAGKIACENSIPSISSSNSVSTTRSISPILKELYDTDSGMGFERKDLDIVSVIDFPVFPNNEQEEEIFDVKRYTLKEVDRICWEALKGPKQRTKQHKKNWNRRDSKQELVLTKKISNNGRKSLTSSEYSSSGYCSSITSNNKPKSATNSMKSYISECFTLEDVSATPSRCNQYETNNNRLSSVSSKNSNHIIDVIRSDEREESADELSHSRQLFTSVKFEELPNFVTYKEEEDLT